MGDSSGTEVAARAALAAPNVVALVLASPRSARSRAPLPRLLLRRRLDSRHEPSGPSESRHRTGQSAGVTGRAG
ncbi:hypothetical protein SRB17_47060 [Streptomyces sp. RB17]|uniref:hypothetical protein n=1 Tax=Streptomyces sp. RB17 TaxID=2585197 RepID=UPI001295E390|nr:hypothetical protein [Streptomyces sp. RB17]MQY36704.1 hypothetical protein [Streptomyces sp. RB17]